MKNKGFVGAVIAAIVVSLGIGIIIIGGVIGGATSGYEQSQQSSGGSGSYGHQNLSDAVLQYEDDMREECTANGVDERYVPVLLAIMMVESRGEGVDVMQSSEFASGGQMGTISSPRESIKYGVLAFKSALDLANRLNLASDVKMVIQGYNYGTYFVQWAFDMGARAYSIDYSEDYSRTYMKAAMIRAGYTIGPYGTPTGEKYPYVNAVSTALGKPYLYSNCGNFLYAELVAQYISSSGGGTSNSAIVQTALDQLGNKGGAKFWSWYGWSGRVEWCACFVSWVANENGYIDTGVVPKFALVQNGYTWFAARNQITPRTSTPDVGAIIFFDWNGDNWGDHVGFVESSSGGMVHTVEGNTSDMVARRSYPVGSSVIMGYGNPAY